MRSAATVAIRLALVALACTACAPPPDLPLPTADEIKSYYTSDANIEASLNGNVAEVVVEQAAAQLRRGGSLWARVGPYIYLFTDDTQKLLEDYPGLAAVRVTTRTASGAQIATALLARTDLSDILWLRSLNISGLARRDGTEHPGRLDDLVRWGEEHTTEHEYNNRYGG